MRSECKAKTGLSSFSVFFWVQSAFGVGWSAMGTNSTRQNLPSNEVEPMINRTKINKIIFKIVVFGILGGCVMLACLGMALVIKNNPV